MRSFLLLTLSGIAVAACSACGDTPCEKTKTCNVGPDPTGSTSSSGVGGAPSTSSSSSSGVGGSGGAGGGMQTVAASFALGRAHGCKQLDGLVECWGEGSIGQIGDGSETDQVSPVGVPLPPARAVAAGEHTSCAILDDGSVRCWGADASAFNVNEDAPSPVAVSGVTGAQKMGVGESHRCAIVQDKTVSCWGLDGLGQLGRGMFDSSTTAKPVVNITDVIDLAVGGNHACVATGTGAIYCWGSNMQGEVGGSITISETTPLQLAGVTGATAVAAGYSSSCAIGTGGAVSCWGNGTRGQIGDGTGQSSPQPKTVTGLPSPAAKITGGADHFCAILTDKSLWCWGYNNEGQCGTGSVGGNVLSPSRVNLDNVTAVSVGFETTCARVESGQAYCWGKNANAFGNGAVANSATPATVPW